MSRIGLNPITIPEGIEYSFSEQLFSVKSSKGTLSLKLDNGFEIIDESNVLTLKRPNDDKKYITLPKTKNILKWKRINDI